MVTKVIPLCDACDNAIDTTKPYGSGEKGRALCAKCADKTEGGSEDTTQGDNTPPAQDLALENRKSEGVTAIRPSGLLPGEQNELHTRQLIRETHWNFLAIGKLLKENRDNAWWSTCGHAKFSDYVESLGISRSVGYSMIAAYEVLSLGHLTEDEILEIGIAKMNLLIGAGKANDADTVELAKVCPVRDLKEHLGHKLLTNDPNHSIICPHCGVAIEGAKWARLTI